MAYITWLETALPCDVTDGSLTTRLHTLGRESELHGLLPLFLQRLCLQRPPRLLGCSTAACKAALAAAHCSMTSSASTSSLHASQIATMKANEYMEPVYSIQLHVGSLPAHTAGDGSGEPSGGQLLFCFELSTSRDAAAYTGRGEGGATSSHGRRAYRFAPSSSVCFFAFSCSPTSSCVWRVGTC